MQYHPIIHINAPDLQLKGGYDDLEVHQDFSSLQSSLDMLVLWIPFFDVTAETCSIDVLPTSHKQGLLNGKTEGRENIIDESQYDDKDFVTVKLNAGDVLIFSGFTAHRTQKNRQNISKLRFATSCRYENAIEKTFITRDYPSRERKVMNRDILYPNFPDKEILKSIFG